MIKGRVVCISLMLLALFAADVYASEASVVISSDVKTSAVGERFRVEVSAQGSYKTLNEPEFKDFSVDNRSQSTSTSISIVNGKMQKSKSISYSYILSPFKSGVFKIGPASVILESGKKIVSNTITVTVLDAPVVGSPKADDEKETSDTQTFDSSSENKSDSRNKLGSSLSEWEKRTPNFFIRSIVEGDDFYEGEPITLRYYIFTKPGAITNIVNYEIPTFEKSWKEESTQSRLNFNRIMIDRTPYDYSLLATFVLIPEKGAGVLRGTQMVVELTTGSFFNVRRQTISSPAINIPLKPLDNNEGFSEGIFGNFNISVDKTDILLDRDNPLGSVTYKVNGCGNLHDISLNIGKVEGVQVFPPDVKTDTSIRNGNLCGSKAFSFIFKGLKKGDFVLGGNEIPVFSREKSWHKIKVPVLNVTVKEISGDHAGGSSDNNKVRYEVLRELPEGLKIYDISMIAQRLWFKIVASIPFLLTAISLFLWFLKGATRKISMSFASKIKSWEEKCKGASDLNELMNIFYDALSDLFSVELRGERQVTIEKKYGKSLNKVCLFIQDMQHSIYSGENSDDIDSFKKRAIELLKPGVYKK
jgi:hypothetical protein